MTAGGNKNFTVFGFEQTLIFPFYNRGSYCGFLGIGKAELFKPYAKLFDTHAVIICYKGRRHARYNGSARLNHNLYLFSLVGYFLSVLRTNYKALTAQNTFVADNVRLIARKAYRLYGAMPDTFIIVFTI